MTDFECRTCGDKWPGTFNLDHCCTVCGGMITATESWREVIEGEEVVNDDA
ncbi:hypothetical protein [Litchfieldella xinjiangensis]|uniref:hypothetical protein n=1 Tax=Litchfieldella xinjiangensis TaxID=1166948 RepID=UPI0012E0489A|nr:hypothetical protein [Halomonas xinjiangensis]